MTAKLSSVFPLLQHQPCTASHHAGLLLDLIRTSAAVDGDGGGDVSLQWLGTLLLGSDVAVVVVMVVVFLECSEKLDE